MEHPINEKDCNTALHSIEDALYVLSGKWKLRIIVAIREGNTRFSEIQKAVHGIAAKVLSKELKDLEQNDLVRREVHQDADVRIEYHPTPYSDTLKEVIVALKDWGAGHKQRLLQKSRLEKRNRDLSSFLNI